MVSVFSAVNCYFNAVYIFSFNANDFDIVILKAVKTVARYIILIIFVDF